MTQSILIISSMFNPFHILSRHLKHSAAFPIFSIAVSYCFFLGLHIKITFSRSASWTLELVKIWLDILPMHLTMVDPICAIWIQHLRTVSCWGRRLMLWSIQPSQGSGCSKSLQCQRLDPSARHSDSGARKLRCWLRRMGWCQSLVDFYFVFLYFVGNMSMYHPCWKQLFRKHPLRLNSGSFLLRNNAWGKAARILYTLRKCLKCFKDTVTVPVNP